MRFSTRMGSLKCRRHASPLARPTGESRHERLVASPQTRPRSAPLPWRAGGGRDLAPALRGAEMSMLCFRLDDVTLGYDGHPAVHHLSGDVGRGSLTAVIGPNGSGKSTLLKGLVGALKPLGGRIERVGFAAHDVAYPP